MSNKDLIDQVNAVVATLENPPYVCESCGNVWESDEETLCPDCESDDVHKLSASDYIEDILDVEYIFGGDKQYLGARILVCFGGPNVWVDTRNNRVEGCWWGDYYSQSFSDEIGLNDFFEDLAECLFDN